MDYQQKAELELRAWQVRMVKTPSFIGLFTKGVQKKVNSYIPENIHKAITSAIKNMVHAVLSGGVYITKETNQEKTFEEQEKLVKEKLIFYKRAAAVEGAGTGAGGFLLSLADFPLLLGFEMKFLFEAASAYGFDVKDYRERLYILHIFQLAFASEVRRRLAYEHILYWELHVENFSEDINDLDWRTFQQEYRDYIDVAKMLQLLPGIGAVVGAFANYRLLDTLGETAINCYRMRIFQNS
jgi:hypothetical protein